jgi:hypothetical protein
MQNAVSYESPKISLVHKLDNEGAWMAAGCSPLARPCVGIRLPIDTLVDDPVYFLNR